MADAKAPKQEPPPAFDQNGLAAVLTAATKADSHVAQVGKLTAAGKRTPKAVFTVITNDGGVMRVEIRRLIAGV